MTEAEWLACADPTPMLRFRLRSKTNKRKLRLFTVACCRRAWHLIEPHAAIRECVDFAERFADGMGAKKRLKKLVDENRRRFTRYGEKSLEDLSVIYAAVAAQCTCEPDVAIEYVCNCVGYALGRSSSADHPAQTAYLRCIFGNPFRPVAAEPAWLTSTAVGLASAIYAERAFDRLPILADALEDAGCDHPDILAHYRNHLEHARGCWVVDLILGKS